MHFVIPALYFQSRSSKERGEGGEEAAWTSPYGCHNEPDLDEFPLPRMNTLPDDPLRAGEQYFLDLAGNIKKGPIAKAQNCHCGPAFEKFEKKQERETSAQPRTEDRIKRIGDENKKLIHLVCP